tara:strand:- start:231 stop:2039 length:1809 start_codon:yes stop_codon:yes gene_type:complete
MAKIQGSGTQSFGQQNLRLGRSEGLSDFAKNLARQTTGNLRRATEARMMGVTSSAFGFLPPIMQASMFGLFTGGGSGSSGSSGTVSRVGGSGPMQSTLWMTNLERLYREPLPVMIVTDRLGFIESQREKPKVIEGTSSRIDAPTKKSGFGLTQLGLAGLAGILSLALMKLRDFLENVNISDTEWLKSILPNDLGDAASLGAKMVAAIGIGSLAKTLIFGSPTGKGGRKGGLLRGMRAVLLKSIRGINWGSFITTGMLAKGFGKLGLGIVQIAFDGIAGWFKSDEWGVDKVTAAIGASIGGTDSGLFGSVSQGLKYGFIGAGIGSVVPGIGTLAGAILGLVIGALIGWVGGKKIAQSLDNILDSIGSSVDEAFDSIYDAILPDWLKKEKESGNMSMFGHMMDFSLKSGAFLGSGLDGWHDVLKNIVGVLDPTWDSSTMKPAEWLPEWIKENFGEGMLRGGVKFMNPLEWEKSSAQDKYNEMKFTAELLKKKIEKIEDNLLDAIDEEKVILENQKAFLNRMLEQTERNNMMYKEENNLSSLLPGYDSILRGSQLMDYNPYTLRPQQPIVINSNDTSGGNSIVKNDTIQVINQIVSSDTFNMQPA